MQTKQIYYEDQYLKELECTVVSVIPSGNFINVITDQTIFYPEGGGQPSDRGTLGNTKVEYVRVSNGEIIHQLKGNLTVGKSVKGIIDWDWRYKYMKIHSAGHLIHDVLITMVKGLTPIKGGHGKKAFIEYQGEMDVNLKEKLEAEVNTVAQQGLEIATKFAAFEELQKECMFVPPNLPKDKPLRMLKIANFPGMPDGGVQVKNTKEIGKIYISLIEVKKGITRIRYGVVGA